VEMVARGEAVLGPERRNLHGPRRGARIPILKEDREVTALGGNLDLEGLDPVSGSHFRSSTRAAGGR